MQMILHSFGQSVGDYGSTNNQNWVGGTWQICTSAGTWSDATATTIPPGVSNNVWILPTHQVTCNSAVQVNNLYVYGSLNDGGNEVKVTGNVIGGGTISGNGRLNIGYVTTQTLPTITSGVTTLTLASANSLVAVGQLVSGRGVPVGTRVTAVSGTTITISNRTTAANTNIPVFFSNPTHNISINGGTLSISCLLKTSSGTINMSGGVSIAGDLVLGPSIGATTPYLNIIDSGYNLTVGGNMYNFSGNRADIRGATNNGWLMLAGTSTQSGLISAGTVSGSTSGFVVGDTLSIIGGSYSIQALAVVTTVSSGSVTAISICDPGTGYAQAPTGFVAKTGKGTGAGILTNAVVANTQAVKYLATGFFHVRRVALASSTPNNVWVHNTGATLQVMDTLLFTATNNTGVYAFSNNTSLYLGGASWNTNVATSGAIIMSPTNYFRGGSSLANAMGTIAFTSWNANQGTVYFDPSANFLSRIQQLGENAGTANLGNSVVLKDQLSLKGGTFVINSGATITLPATIASVMGVTNGINTGVYGGLNAKATGSKVVFSGTANLPTTIFSPTTISSLSVVNKATITYNQSIQILDSLQLEASSVFKSGGAYTLTVSGITAGSGVLDAASGSVIMNGSTNQTINMATAGNLTINNANGVNASPAVTGLLTVTNGDLSDYSNVATTASVLFDGLNTQIANAGLGTISNLTISNMNGVKLTGSATVNGTLSILSGKLFAGDKTLKLGGSASFVQSVPANNYIVIDGSGSVMKTVAAGVNTLFPIGTSTTYNPVTLTPSASSDIYVSVYEGNNPALSNIGGTLDVTKTLNRTWKIVPTIPSATDITLGYDGGVDANAGFDNAASDIALLNNSGSWVYAQHVVPGLGVGTLKTASFTGITSFSNFTLANPGNGAVYINGVLPKANDEYRSAKSGNWDEAATWEVLNANSLNWEPTVTIPSSVNTVTIRNGHTITLTSQAGIGTLTVESGAVLQSSLNAFTSTPIILKVSKPTAIFTNNGIIGVDTGTANTTNGDGLSIVLDSTCKSFSLSGNGRAGIGSLYALAGNNNLIAIIDQSIQLRHSSASAKKVALSMIDPANTAGTGSRTFILKSGKTIALADSNACVHSATFNGNVSVISAVQGDITYDIQGVLDLKGGNIYLSSSSSANAATQKLKLNIGSNGQITSVGDFNVHKAQATQAVYTYIEDGGLLDASGAMPPKTNEFGLSRNATATATLAAINNNSTVTVAAGRGGYYLTTPSVTVTGISAGSGLTATAVLTGNTVTSIVFSGSNGAYTGTPIISIAPSTVGDLSWVVMGGINASYKRYVTNVAEIFNVAIPPVSGDYSTIKGNPVQIMFQPSFANDVYTVSVAKDISPAPVTFSKDFGINRTWKIKPTNLKTGFDYATYIAFGFTSGVEDANTSFSPTYPSFTYGTSAPDLNGGYTVPTGNMDLMMYRDFTKTWVLNGGYFNTNVPSVGNFGTTWQIPGQLGANTYPPGFMLTNFFPPHLYTIKNTAAPFICP